ncbi:MAG TPA: 50S ribosomal protein L21 [Candidatus Absconditabacterales bacterium]|nr:50S ribosomal protein L21 [Candidatus Absconditabacterales bacterium]
MYAVIELQGHQYVVNEGLELIVDKIEGKKGAKIDIKEVLSVFDAEGKNVKVGKPFVEKAKVSAEILETKKGKKINVLKFKKKNRYERNFGFRPHQTVLKIKKIDLNG